MASFDVLSKVDPQAVENAINASAGTYRYMVAPGCEITADTPIENVKALVNATKKNSY